MKKIKKLVLKKETISNLSHKDLNNLKGGGFTAGCTDGCGPMATAWNCTEADCTNDCTTLTPCASWDPDCYW